MVKKKIQQIWHAGLQDFAARRASADAAREPAQRVQAPDRDTDDHVRRAVVAATAPLRQELDALKAEVAELRERVGDRK